MSQLVQQRDQGNVQLAQGRITIMPSSWIRNVDYNMMTNELRINMRGKWYGPWFVNQRTYNKFITGQAVPITNDSKNRWARGLGPSIGAAFHKYIKIGGKRAKITRRFAELKAKIKPSVTRKSQFRTRRYRQTLGQRVMEKYKALSRRP